MKDYLFYLKHFFINDIKIIFTDYWNAIKIFIPVIVSIVVGMIIAKYISPPHSCVYC